MACVLVPFQHQFLDAYQYTGGTQQLTLDESIVSGDARFGPGEVGINSLLQLYCSRLWGAAMFEHQHGRLESVDRRSTNNKTQHFCLRRDNTELMVHGQGNLVLGSSVGPTYGFTRKIARL